MIYSFILGLAIFATGLARGLFGLCLVLATFALGLITVAMTVTGAACLLYGTLAHCPDQIISGAGFIGYAAAAFALIVAMHAARVRPTLDAPFIG